MAEEKVDIANLHKIIPPVVIDLIEGQPTRKWDESGLSSAIQKRTGIKRPLIIKMIIRHMVQMGILEGRANEQGVVFGITKAKGDANPKVAALEKQVEEEKQKFNKAVTEFQKHLNERKDLIDKLEKQCKETRAQERVVEVKLFNGPKVVKSTKGIFHKEFETLLDLAKARENIFIYGPTGSGKTFIASQLAESLKLKFGFVSCTTGMGEGVLGGRLLPVGKDGMWEFIISEFLLAYEVGGVFLLDEIDAADPNAMLFINAALSNDVIAVYNRKGKPYAKRHADFICIAAGNTVGTGADRMYSGRNKLDMAFMDRFGIGKVFMDYDPIVEQTLCPDDELRAILMNYRKGINAHRLERALSTRFIEKAYKMKHKHGWDMERINKAFFLGWREDEMNKVKMYQG